MILKRQYKVFPDGVVSPSSIEIAAPSTQNSNRNKPGNRNARNLNFINDLNFSNRNKTRGVDGEQSEEFTKTLPASGRPSNVKLPTSNLCKILIDTQIIRTHLNSLGISATYRSNRYKTGPRKIEKRRIYEGLVTANTGRTNREQFCTRA